MGPPKDVRESPGPSAGFDHPGGRNVRFGLDRQPPRFDHGGRHRLPGRVHGHRGLRVRRVGEERRTRLRGRFGPPSTVRPLRLDRSAQPSNHRRRRLEHLARLRRIRESVLEEALRLRVRPCRGPRTAVRRTAGTPWASGRSVARRVAARQAVRADLPDGVRRAHPWSRNRRGIDARVGLAPMADPARREEVPSRSVGCRTKGVTARRRSAARRSARAIDRDGQGVAHLAHTSVAQPAEPVDQDGKRDAFDRVEVDRRTARYGVVSGLKHHFADEPTNVRRARRDQCAPVPRDRRITREHDDRTAADLGHLAPPNLAPRGQCGHVAAAARRNEARSPHSSGSSSGCSSYAA